MTLEKYKTCLKCGDDQPNCCSEASMTRKTEIAELKELFNNSLNIITRRAIEKALAVIDSLEAENKELKSFSEGLHLAANSLRAKTKELEHKYDLLRNFFFKNFTKVVMLNLGDEPELDFLAENKELKKMNSSKYKLLAKEEEINHSFSLEIIKQDAEIRELKKKLEIALNSMKEAIVTANKYYPNTADGLKYSIQLIQQASEKITGGKNESN